MATDGYYERLYEYRFLGISQTERQQVWNVIAQDIWQRMERPSTILDPAGGRCEFINALPGIERWVIDQVDVSKFCDPSAKQIVGDVFDADLPPNHFGGVFVSNFLEHLSTPTQVAMFLDKTIKATAPGGRIAVLGPNFRYCHKNYFDCADHILALTEVSVCEHLYATGWEISEAIPQYLPYSFRGHLRPSPQLVKLYLSFPPAWRILGKQFLVTAIKPNEKVKGR